MRTLQRILPLFALLASIRSVEFDCAGRTTGETNEEDRCRRRFGERFRAAFDEVTEDHVPYVVTRGQQPEAVLVPHDELQRLLKQSDDEVLRRFDEVRGRIRERTAGY